MHAGQQFLAAQDTPDLLKQVGRTVRGIPPFRARRQVGSARLVWWSRNRVRATICWSVEDCSTSPTCRKLYLDCTAGHYQMLWGYNHPDLCAAIAAAVEAGIVWDNHSNIPQSPLKRLGKRLMEAGNAPGAADPLDTVLLGVCTGTVACAAALKIQLMVFQRTRGSKGTPVIVVLDGNYHGSDMAAQFMRGMWPGMAPGFKVVTLQPNDTAALDKAFRRYGERVAGFWAEPVMMNREAIAVEPEYLLTRPALVSRHRCAAVPG